MADATKPRRTRIERGIYSRRTATTPSAPGAPGGFTSAPPAATWEQLGAPEKI